MFKKSQHDENVGLLSRPDYRKGAEAPIFNLTAINLRNFARTALGGIRVVGLDCTRDGFIDESDFTRPHTLGLTERTSHITRSVARRR